MIRFFIIKLTFCYARVFLRQKTYGKENLKLGQKGVIVACNHVSFWDPPLLGAFFPKKVHFFGRSDLFKSFLGWLLHKLDTHPIHRGRGNVDAIKKAVRLINKGYHIAIFPEGKRSVTGEFLKGQLGIGMLVMRTKCLVVPTYIHGTYELWSTKRRFPKPFGKVACIFGSPLDFSSIDSTNKREAQREIVDKIMEAIADLKRWYLAGAKGSPP